MRRWFVDLAIALGAWGTCEVDPVAHLAFTIAECRCLPLMILPGLGLVVVLTARIFVTERERERERERFASFQLESYKSSCAGSRRPTFVVEIEKASELCNSCPAYERYLFNRTSWRFRLAFSFCLFFEAFAPLTQGSLNFLLYYRRCESKSRIAIKNPNCNLRRFFYDKS